MSDYEQLLEQQNEELKERLAKYEAAINPIFGLLIRCEKQLEESNKELELVKPLFEEKYGHAARIIIDNDIRKNKELIEQCGRIYGEQTEYLKEFDEGKWLDFYVDTYNMKK